MGSLRKRAERVTNIPSPTQEPDLDNASGGRESLVNSSQATRPPRLARLIFRHEINKLTVNICDPRCHFDRVQRARAGYQDVGPGCFSHKYPACIGGYCNACAASSDRNESSANRRPITAADGYCYQRGQFTDCYANCATTNTNSL